MRDEPPASRFHEAGCPTGGQVSEKCLCPARMRIAEVLVPAAVGGTSQVKKRIGSYPRGRVVGCDHGVVSQAGAVLLVETARKTGLDQAISTALMPWRRPRGRRGRGDCLADVGMLRAEPAVFGPVASDPTVSRLIDTLAAAGRRPCPRYGPRGPKPARASGPWPRPRLGMPQGR
jgi:hypothetical protein